MSDGYLGIGLDVFGNYENPVFGGSGCATGGFTSGDQYPESITARGPGSGTNGYCILASTATSTLQTSGSNLPGSKLLDNKSATSRSGLAVPVEIAINPSSSSTTAETSGLPVPANSWFIAYQPVGVSSWSSTYSLSGTLPTVSNNTSLASFPSSWINPSTGIPYDLTFGWAASTGGSNEIHEVATLAASSLNGTVPVLSVTNTDNESGNFVAGNQASYTITPTVSANDVANDEGSESQPITVTDTFPSGVTPGDATGTNWVCQPPSGQVVSCVYTPGSAIAPGTSLPSITLPISVSAATTGSINAVARVTSDDGDPGTATDTANSVALSATTSPSSDVFGDATTFNAVGLPSGAYGDTVTVMNGSTTLCSFTYSASISSCQASGMTAGTYSSATEDWSGDTNYAAQVIDVPSFAITKAPTTTSLAESVPSAVAGQQETLTATVDGGAAGTPTGTVDFKVGGVGISGCTSASVVSGVASCTTTFGVGSATLSALYSGDSNFTTSNGSGSLNEGAGLSSTTLTSGPPSPVAGDTENLTATVAAVTPAAGTPTGTVEFTAGGVAISGCNAVQLVNAIATCSTMLPVGVTDVTALYSGNSNFDASSDAETLSVALDPTTTTATSSPNSPQTGASETLTATVATTGNVTPTGTVEFIAGGVAISGCAAVQLVHAVATCSAVLPVGETDIAVSYSGDSLNAASSGTTNVTVTASLASPPSNVGVSLSTSGRSSGNATISWTPGTTPVGSGPVTYVVTAEPGGLTCVTTGTSCTITGLKAGVTYSFEVAASDASGVSASTRSESPTPRLIASPMPEVLGAKWVPVRATCDRSSCIGTVNVTVARRVYNSHGRQIGWNHLVLAKTSFSLVIGQKAVLRLIDTTLGRSLLPRQTHWWLARRPRFHMTLTTALVASTRSVTKTFLKAKG